MQLTNKNLRLYLLKNCKVIELDEIVKVILSMPEINNIAELQRELYEAKRDLNFHKSLRKRMHSTRQHLEENHRHVKLQMIQIRNKMDYLISHSFAGIKVLNGCTWNRHPRPKKTKIV